MHRFLLRSFVSIVLFFIAWPAASRGDILAQFDFNTADGNASTGTMAPSVGTGAFIAIGGATTFYGFGAGSGDPAVGADNSALGLGGFPSQGSASGTVGFQAEVSTVGFNDITLTFDQKNQPSANKFFEVQVRTSAAGPFAPVAVYGIAAADVWENGKTFNLSATPAAANNPDFAVRVVGVFEPNTSQYVASEAGYNGQIPTLLDMVTIHGSVVPEPQSGLTALLALLSTVGLAKRRV